MEPNISASHKISVISHTVEALTSLALRMLADYVHQHPESYQHITTTRL
jgi:hypothetical protein